MEEEESKSTVYEELNSPNKPSNNCCETSAPCCENAVTDEINKKNNTDTSITEMKDKDKLYVDIFVPLNACECVWSQFMNLVFSTITPYMKHIKFETKNLDSEEARKLNLTGNCVVVDGRKKFITSFALKKELPNLLKEKGLI
ncbi:MAG: hypothetical protein ACFE96_02280 [Candidatus Hermodarchaeota archaeon]